MGIKIASDHLPFLGGCGSILKLKNAPQTLQKMWLSHPEFMKVVADCWKE